MSRPVSTEEVIALLERYRAWGCYQDHLADVAAGREFRQRSPNAKTHTRENYMPGYLPTPPHAKPDPNVERRMASIRTTEAMAENVKNGLPAWAGLIDRDRKPTPESREKAKKYYKEVRVAKDKLKREQRNAERLAQGLPLREKKHVNKTPEETKANLKASFKRYYHAVLKPKRQAQRAIRLAANPPPIKEPKPVKPPRVVQTEEERKESRKRTVRKQWLKRKAKMLEAKLNDK